MNGLPPDTDFSWLVGHVLESVSVSLHQVNLHFDGQRVFLSVESEYEVKVDGVLQRFANAPDGSAKLVCLLGRAVTSASGTPDGTLTVDWTGPACLKVHDSEAHYESYQVSNGDLFIIV